MGEIVARAYREGDLDAMLAMARWALRAESPQEYPRGQLCWEVPRMASPEEQVTLWEHEGTLVAAALFYPGRGMGYLVLPGWSEDVEGEVVKWGERRCAATGTRVTIVASDRQRERVGVLGRLGYAKVEHEYMPVMGYGGSPVRLEVEGFETRAIKGDDELAERVRVQRAAFGARTVTTEENYARVMRTPDYLRELDVVAVAPTGEFAAFCLAWCDDREGRGMLEPMGVDPAYRGRGLGKLVVAEAVRRLERLGVAIIQVCHDQDNPAARAVYEACGFREFDRMWTWEKRAIAGNGD